MPRGTQGQQYSTCSLYMSGPRASKMISETFPACWPLTHTRPRLAFATDGRSYQTTHSLVEFASANRPVLFSLWSEHCVSMIIRLSLAHCLTLSALPVLPVYWNFEGSADLALSRLRLSRWSNRWLAGESRTVTRILSVKTFKHVKRLHPLVVLQSV